MKVNDCEKVGNWNPIEPDVVCREYAGVTLQVWLALLIVNPNKTGVFSIFPYDIPGIVSKIRKCKTKKLDVEAGLKTLEEMGWIKRYPNNIVWIIDRWQYVGNRNHKNIIENARNLVAQYPTVWKEFKEYYGIQCNQHNDYSVTDTVIDSVNNSVGNKGKGKGKGKVKERKKDSDKPESSLNSEKNIIEKSKPDQQKITDTYCKCYLSTFESNGITQETLNKEFDWKRIGKRCTELLDKYDAETIQQAILFIFDNHDDLWSKHLSNFTSVVTQAFISKAVGMMRNPNAGKERLGFSVDFDE